MITTLLAWIYITFLSWIWGILFLQLIKRLTKSECQLPHFSIICIAGLSTITVIAGLLSLLVPLGNWWMQLLFIGPCLIFHFKKNGLPFFNSFRKEFSGLHAGSLIFLLALLLLILVMSTWTIVHPDTLGYHAQTIQWIEKYKAIPGIVHLHVRFGYQGLWFVDSALFGFSFSGKEGFTFLNSTVLVWFFIFIINRIDYNFFRDGKKLYGWLWFTLLFLTMWSYTQVRLTATSASPDFIATLFVLTILYLLFQKTGIENWLLPVFLSIIGTTIKLSAAPMLLIVAAALIIFLKNRKMTLLLALAVISAVSVFPFIARNVISSGYVVFPSTAFDIANVDWKYDQEHTINEKNYITAYAKRPGVETKDEIVSAMKMSSLEWLPGWWQHRSTADKVILCLLVISFLAALLSLNKIIRSGFVTILSLLTMLTGIIFWLINAPDPRFGFGQILGFIAIVTYLILKDKEIAVNRSVLSAALIAFTMIIVAYTGYRFINFFNKDQLLTPLGIEKTFYKTFDCDGFKINSPVDNDDFGTIPIPCTDLNCESFSPRGTKITDGFRAK